MTSVLPGMSLPLREKLRSLETEAFALSREIEIAALDDRILLCTLKSGKQGPWKIMCRHLYLRSYIKDDEDNQVVAATVQRTAKVVNRGKDLMLSNKCPRCPENSNKAIDIKDEIGPVFVNNDDPLKEI